MGGFDPALGVLADWDLWIRLAQSSKHIGVNEPLLAYARHQSNMTRDLSRVRDEVAYVERKYAAERSTRGIGLDQERWLDWIADTLRRAGFRRRPALIWVGIGLMTRSFRPLIRAAVAAHIRAGLRFVTGSAHNESTRRGLGRRKPGSYLCALAKRRRVGSLLAASARNNRPQRVRPCSEIPKTQDQGLGPDDRFRLPDPVGYRNPRSSPRSDGGAPDGSKPNEVATVMSQDQRLQDFIVGARRLLETPRL